MCQHLGIGGLVARRDLHDVVEHQDAAIRDAVEDADALIFALLVGKRLAFELHRLGVTACGVSP